MIISFANQKGGVGKTTTTLSLASVLASKGKKILVVDLDPQSNLTSGIGFERSRDYKSIYDVLIQDEDISRVFIPSDVSDNLFLVPSKIDLAASEIELVSKMSRERILKEKLDKVKDDFDYILIDCPPSLGLLTVNAMVASDGVIIPVQCEYFALEGISQLANTISLVKKSLNSKLNIAGVVMTMFDARTKLSVEVVKEVQGFFREKLFNTIIPRNVRISESPSFGKPIDKYDPSSVGAKSYVKLADEFLERFEKKTKVEANKL
jgi:chromosome partitioning protein